MIKNLISSMLCIATSIILGCSLANSTESAAIVVLLDGTSAFTEQWDSSRDLTKEIVNGLRNGDDFTLIVVPEEGAQDETNVVVRGSVKGAILRRKQMDARLRKEVESLPSKPSGSAADIYGSLVLVKHQVREQVVCLFIFADLTQAIRDNIELLAKIRFAPGSEVYCFNLPYRDENTYDATTLSYADVFKQIGFTEIDEHNFFSEKQSDKSEVRRVLKEFRRRRSRAVK